MVAFSRSLMFSSLGSMLWGPEAFWFPVVPVMVVAAMVSVGPIQLISTVQRRLGALVSVASATPQSNISILR